MTTITIKNGELAKKTFKDVEDLFEFIADSISYGKLFPIDKATLSETQKNRIKKALATDKSQMRNI